MEILKGHTSPETAYVVNDYPYGFRLRCTIRYWIEFNEKQGFRFWSQTTNPKRGNVWNKPKASTYSRFGGAMFLNEQGHVEFAGLTEYSDAKETATFIAMYGEGVPEAGKARLAGWLKAKQNYEANRASGMDMAEAAAASVIKPS